MKKIVTVICLVAAPVFSFCQGFTGLQKGCSCETKFQFVKHEIETNYAGFQDKVNDTNRKDYLVLTDNCGEKAKKTYNEVHCLTLIRGWLKFFNDGHLQLSKSDFADIESTDTLAINIRSSKTEVINISPEKLKKLKDIDSSEEGIYVNLMDSTYTVAIIKDKTEFRDFAGVVLTSRTPFWKPGQVKLEIKKPEDNSNIYPAILYDRFHNYHLRQFSFGGMWFDGQAWSKFGWVPEWMKDSTKKIAKTDFRNVQSKKLDDSTLYIQIGTFNSSNADAIEAVFKENEKVLKTTPHLILDLRNNGGGSDGSYSPILPYVYTHPISETGNDFYATKDNINRRKEWLKDPDLSNEEKEEIKEHILEMEKHLGQWALHAGDDTLVMEKVAPYPKRIVILINSNCASTTEQFLLAARQSRKVILMGEHTYGELDYSNMLEAESPCKEIVFYYSTTRSRRLDIGQGIDNVGIQPDIILTEDKDWIKEAQQYLSE